MKKFLQKCMINLKLIINTLNNSSSEVFSSKYKHLLLLFIVLFFSTSVFSQTTDTDGDGIADVIDLDDDNDGILDSDECNNKVLLCFDGSFGNQTLPSIASYQCLTTVNSSPDLTLPNWSAYAAGTPTSPDGGAFFTIVHQKGTWDESASFPLSNLTVGATYKFKFYQMVTGHGSSWFDGGNFIFKSGTTVLATSATMAATNATGAGRQWQYQELPFVATSTSMTITISGTTTDPNSTIGTRLGLDGFSVDLVSDCDTDNDGKPNHLDLDSDNDGCSDAIESRSSATATSTTVFPTGADTNANGLLDIYEGTAAGSYNYVSTYTNYALLNSINICFDADGDGLRDIFDIDDDNDGALDATESPSCFMTTNEWNTANKAFNVTVSSDLSTLSPNTNFAALTDGNASTGAVQFSTATAQSQLNRELLKFNFQQPIQLDAFYIKKTSATQIFAAAANSVMIQGSNDDKSWTNLLAAAITAPADATNVTANGAVTLTNSNKFSITTNAAPYKYYRIYGVAAGNILGGIASELYFDVNTINYNPSFYPKSTCTEDIDTDGKLNHQDLDSDGDTCSDALEAGSSSSAKSTTVFPTGADTNGNGLLNVYESTTTAGAINYTSFYSDFALNNSLNICSDNDGDGVQDIFDIDDDNDGVLDVEEMSCTSASMSKTGVTVSSPGTWTFYNAAGNLNGLVDGVDGTIAEALSSRTVVTYTNQTVLQFDLPKATVLTQIEIGNWPGQSSFNVGGTFKMQAWDGTQWADVSDVQTISNTAPILAVNNSIKFNMPNNNSAFTKYRIFVFILVGSNLYVLE